MIKLELIDTLPLQMTYFILISVPWNNLNDLSYLHRLKIIKVRLFQFCKMLIENSLLVRYLNNHILSNLNSSSTVTLFRAKQFWPSLPFWNFSSKRNIWHMISQRVICRWNFEQRTSYVHMHVNGNFWTQFYIN